MDFVLPIIPIPSPKTKYTITIKLNISLNSKSFNLKLARKLINAIFLLTIIYNPDTNASETIPEESPIIIPSTINGHLIKLFVAPTYFMIDISFLLA